MECVICVTNSIPEIKECAIVTDILTMVVIMSLWVTLPWKETENGPRVRVTAMSFKRFECSNKVPNYHRAPMHVSSKKLDSKSRWHKITNEILERMSIFN